MCGGTDTDFIASVGMRLTISAAEKSVHTMTTKCEDHQPSPH